MNKQQPTCLQLFSAGVGSSMHLLLLCGAPRSGGGLAANEPRAKLAPVGVGAAQGQAVWHAAATLPLTLWLLARRIVPSSGQEGSEREKDR